MSWWLWALFGIGLLVVEMATPGGLFALFFGVGALLSAVLAAVGVGEIWQWVAFSVSSVVLLLTLRRTLQDRLFSRAPGPMDQIVGEEATLLDDLPAGGEVKAELRGVPWSARASSGLALRKGQRCRVERIEGLTLWVRGE